MDLKQLNTFLEIALLQSFTQAADKLGYAQSTITIQIQALESELDTKLFERLGRNIALTQEGEHLLPYAKEILRLSSEAKSAVKSFDIPKGKLTIGAVESLCVIRLPEILKEYRRLYPEVELTLKFGTCAEFKRLLRDNMIDVAFFLDKDSEDTEFITEVKFPEPMVFLASPEHKLAKKEKVNVKDLESEPLILTEKSCSYRAAFEEILTKFSVRPHSILEVGSVQAIKQLVISELGVTLLPKVAVEEELIKQRLSALNWDGPSFNMITQLVYHKDKWISAALKSFLMLAKDRIPLG